MIITLALAGCGGSAERDTAGAQPGPPDVVEALAPGSPAASAAASAKPSKPPSPKPTRSLSKTVAAGGDTAGTVKPAPSGDGVPTHGAGTFTVAAGGTDQVGTGEVLVKYRVELEDGILWGTNPVWTPASFAAVVDQTIAGGRSWQHSDQAPITDPAEQMTNASWSFQRVSGSDYSVRVRLATPDTVDRLCGAVGVQTQGVYSCRYGQTIMINLRRWLRGAPDFPVDIATYRTHVINHEMGHFLGFDHMHCPAAGGPAPVMQTQTISLEGCTPNAYPYAADGTFILGPWAPS